MPVGGWLELQARQSDPPPQCALSGRACIIIGQIHYQQRFKVAHKTGQYTKKLPCALEYTIQKHAHRFSHGLLIELTLLVADIFFAPSHNAFSAFVFRDEQTSSSTRCYTLQFNA